MKLGTLILLFSLYICKPIDAQLPSTPVKLDNLDSLIQLDGVYSSKSDIINRLFVRSEIVTRYISVFNNEEKAAWYTKLGESHLYLGESILAIEYFKKSLKIEESKVRIHSNEMIARAFIFLKELDSAQVYHYKALELATSSLDKTRIRNSLGYTFFLDKKYGLANDNYEMALLEFSIWENKDSIQYYVIQSNSVSLAIAEGENSKALNLLLKVKEWSGFKNYGDWFVLEILYKELSLKMGDENCLLSTNLMDQIGDIVNAGVSNSDHMNYITKRIQLASLCGDKQELVVLIESYVELSERFKHERNKSIMAIEELQRKNQNYQNELLKLNYALRLNEGKILAVSNRRHYQLVLLLVIIAGVILLVGLFWLRFKRGQQIKREKYLNVKNELLTERNLSSELQLTLRNKEIETRKLELQSIISGMDINSDLFKEISNRLGAIKVQSSKAKSEIQQLIMFIKGKVNYEMIDEVLRTHEDLIQADFKARVLEQFPALTTSELQLLVLVRMQLTNHEMAQLKNVEASSIRTLKYRLKKKMGIGKDKSLTDFLTII